VRHAAPDSPQHRHAQHLADAKIIANPDTITG
jgi:hypothetical protein